MEIAYSTQEEELIKTPESTKYERHSATNSEEERLTPKQSILPSSSEVFGEDFVQRGSHDEKMSPKESSKAVKSKRIEVAEAEARFQENLLKLKDLVEEEEMVIAKIEEMYQNKGMADTEDLMEALLYEFRVRANAEKNVIEDLGKNQNEIECVVQELIECQKKDVEEATKLRQIQEVKAQRQIGTYKKFQDKNTMSDDSEMYDWLVDITLLTDVCKGGWKVEFSPHFCTYNQEYIAFSQKKALDAKIASSSQNINSGEQSARKQSLSWEGAIVSVVGLYDKGKTFVLNNITNSNLPSGKKVNTKGLSFKHVNVDNGTNLVLLDTAGSYSPVRVVNELSVLEKEATEMFILDMVFEISDYFICVVNDFTSLDQRYLDKIARNLQNSPTKTFREVIVVHNLKEVDTQEVLDHLWTTQVTQIYGSGSIQKTKVAAVNLETKKLEERHVVWFKTNYTRHICLCNDDSPLGSSINAWAFSLLKYWLKTVFVPVNRPFSVIDSVMTQAATKLSSYFRMNVNLSLEETSDPLIRYIQTNSPIQDSSSRIPQISTDSTGFVMTRPDNFLPQVDIVQGNEYIIYMDVSGLSKEDISVSRQNTITIVKGNRKKPKDLEEGTLEKNERKYGEFTMTFKIPDIYERKWKGCIVENGVLRIWYPKDDSDNDDHELGENEQDQ